MTDLKKLAEVKRFDPMVDNGEFIEMAEIYGGQFVRYSDYTLLQQEVETLRDALEIFGEHKVNCKADRRIGDCDCGLARALARHEEAAPQEGTPKCGCLPNQLYDHCPVHGAYSQYRQPAPQETKP